MITVWRFCLIGACIVHWVAGAAEPRRTLRVAAAQFRSSENLGDNVRRIESVIRRCGEQGVQVVVFPECAISGYFEGVITNLTAERIVEAQDRIVRVCRETKVCALVGTPFRDGAKLFNSALIISPSGVVGRYDKIQLAESWPAGGERLMLFRIDGTPCSVLICHDERYPELVRLPVLAGAQVTFYLSHESGLKEEQKLNPYRAQIQARAVENTIYIVHANAPANRDASGSHGQSRIIAPDGNVLKEASMFNEDLLIAELDLSKATRENARRSLTRGPLQAWWKAGLESVQRVE